MANIVNATLTLWIYTGDYGTKDTANPSYVLYKEARTGSEIITFEIAELVKDYVEVNFTGDYSNITQSAWAEWEMTRVYDDDTVDTTLKGNAIVFNGYGYFKDQINPQLSDDVLISNTNIFHNCKETTGVVLIGADSTLYTADDSVLTADLDVEGAPNFNRLYIPILTGTDGAVKVVYYDSGGTTISTTTLGGGSTKKLNADNTTYTVDGDVLTADMTYVMTADSEITDVVEVPNNAREIAIERADGSIKYLYVKCIECSKYEPCKISFVNKFGVVQDLWFDKLRKDNIQISNSSYTKSTIKETAAGISYSLNNASEIPTGFSAKKSMTLNTGFVTEDQNEVIQQLMLTENAWIHEDSNVFPIIPKTSSLQYKTSLKDKLINFTIDFEYAYNELNIIK